MPLVTQAAQFSDVMGTNVNYSAIEYVHDKGIVEGYQDGNFRPEASINRAEFVKILVKTHYSDSDISLCKDSKFTDVPADAWFAPYVCVAQKNHVVDGYPGGTFQPENPILFVEAAKILTNTMLPQENVVENKNTWYEPYVKALSNQRAIPESITGFDAYLTRGEMAQMIYRLDAKLTSLVSLSFDEMNDRNLIASYYSNISAGKFDEAYNMKISPEMSLGSFKTLYKDFPYTTVYNFHKVAEHTFTFNVRTLPHLEADSEKDLSELYEVKMEVMDGKLKTLTSQLVTQKLLEEATNGTVNASLEWDNGIYKIYVYPDGKKTLVSERSTKEGIVLTLQNLRVSQTGKYLIYNLGEWEFGGIVVYDIANDTDHVYPGMSVYGFTENDEHFYFCSESGMGSGEVSVTDLPGFENIHDVVDNGKLTISDCGPFDKSTNTLHYEVRDSKADKMTNATYTIN